MQFSPVKGRGGVAEMLTIALPMIVSTSCDGIMTFTDRLFLSRLGPDQMNAAMGGGVAMQMMMFFFIGLTGYTTALVAQYFGAGQKKMAPVAAFQAILITLLAYPLIIVCRPLGLAFFHVMDIQGDQLIYQTAYFNIVLYGVGIGILRNVLSSYFSGLGRTRIVMFASLASMLVNVALDYCWIFGKFGFPAMGVRGAAYATITGGVAGLLVLTAVYFHRHNWREYKVFASFRFNREVMGKLLYFGYPAGLELFLNFLAFTTMILLFHSHGPVSATASTIMFNWDLVSFIPLLGIEIAVTSLVGRYMGAGDPETAHRSAMSGIQTGIFYSFVVLLLFLFIPESLVRIFRPSNDSAFFEQVVPVATAMIRIAALYVLAEAVMVAVVGALRGAGDTHFTMMISVGAHWSFVPVLYLILKVWKLSPVVGWLALVLVFLLFCSVLILRYRSGKWQRIKIVTRDEGRGTRDEGRGTRDEGRGKGNAQCK
jgi:MATE family multidrug resistance protein